jgi:hypothetical protein
MSTARAIRSPMDSGMTRSFRGTPAARCERRQELCRGEDPTERCGFVADLRIGPRRLRNGAGNSFAVGV